MNRRTTLALAAAPGLPLLPGCTSAPAAPAAQAPAMRTRWTFRTSPGLDAVAFLGPLSGKPFYARHYPDELAIFKPRLSPAVHATIASLFDESDAAGTLLWPWLALLLSGGDTTSLADLQRSLQDDAAALRAPIHVSPYASAASWSRFSGQLPRLREVFAALTDAGFEDFQRQCFADGAARVAQLQRRFAGIDVAAQIDRYVARPVDPRFELKLLWFCRPHGVKLQGQRFIAHAHADDRVIVLTAAHEPLHPPFDMQGPVARRCLDILAADPLLTRILAEKDASSGYNSLAGLFEEDVVQAIDQIVQERLGFAVPAGERWRRSDEGIHVIAAALYGLLRADGFDREGGDIEAWLGRAAAAGRLASHSLHAASAAVREQPVERLWAPDRRPR